MIFIATRKEREVDCPNCGARWGQACRHTPTDANSEVMWYHLERSATVRGVPPHWEAL